MNNDREKLKMLLLDILDDIGERICTDVVGGEVSYQMRPPWNATVITDEDLEAFLSKWEEA